MKDYMIITVVDGEQHVSFADSYLQAHAIAMDVECGLGGWWQIYVWTDTDPATGEVLPFHWYDMIEEG